MFTPAPQALIDLYRQQEFENCWITYRQDTLRDKPSSTDLKEATHHLEFLARKRDTTTYSDICTRIWGSDAIMDNGGINGQYRKRVGSLLTHIILVTYPLNNVILPVIVVEKHHDVPSPNGFKSFAMDIENPDHFRDMKMMQEAVYLAYSNNR